MPGTGGAILAADEISSVFYQIIKLAWGPLDTANLVSTTDPIPVDLRTDNLSGNLDVAVASLPASTNTLEVVGDAAHDAVVSGNPLLVGAYASAAAPTNVSADGDVVRLWSLLNGSPVVNLASGGTLITGDGSNGLDVDVTRVTGTVTVAGAVTNTVLSVVGSGTEATAQRVTIATDSTGVLSVDDNNSSLTVDNAALSVVGSGLESTALRVTIATDSTGVLSVDDNGSSLTVDGTVAVSALPASTNTLEVVGDVAHDAPAAGNPVLLAAYASAAAPADVSADADAVRLWALRNGSPVVNLASGGTLITGDGANGLDVDVTRVTGTVTVAGAVTNTVLSVVGGGAEATAQRVTIANDSTGVLSVDDNGASLTVDGTVAVSSLPASTNTLEVVGDVAHDAPAAGNPVLLGAYASAAAPTNVSTDADAVRLWALLNGSQVVNLAAGGTLITGDGPNGLDVDVTRVTGTVTVAGAVTNTVLSVVGSGTEATAQRVTIATDSTGVLSVDDNGGSLTIDGTVTANAGTGNFATAGDVAHDAVDSGAPQKIGAQARQTWQAAVADADRANLVCDDLGRLITVPHGPRDLVVQNRITLTSTSETTLLAQVASTFLDLTDLTISNESATEVRVDIRDATTGSVVWSVDLAADGGGISKHFPVPFKQTTANNNWTAQLSTGVSTVYITAQAIKNV